MNGYIMIHILFLPSLFFNKTQVATHSAQVHYEDFQVKWAAAASIIQIESNIFLHQHIFVINWCIFHSGLNGNSSFERAHRGIAIWVLYSTIALITIYDRLLLE